MRDLWALSVVLGLGAVLVHSIGAPLGEAVADDFDFLHSALLLHRHGFFEGGGSLSFWRPLAHQVYYSLLGGTILSRPWLIALLHILLLGASTLLLYRILRRSWSGPFAAAAATFPLLAESSRALIAWPSHFVDLGALFFAVLALHEAAFRRMATALLALLASLLCKEAGIVAALLLPWMPSLGREITVPSAANREGGAVQGPARPARATRSPLTRERMLWIGGTLAVILAWGLAYLYVRRSAGLALPHRLENNAEIAATPWPVRFGWAFWNSLRAIMSLPATPTTTDWIYGASVAVLLLAALAWVVSVPRARARVRGALPWTVWGAAWFLAFSAGLTAIYPIWAPYRAVFGAVGLGIAATALLGAIHPVLLVALVAVRAVAFAASPGPPPAIASEAPSTGAFLDYERLIRLQRLMADIRRALHARHPTLPHGSQVGQHYFPRSAMYALEGDRALQIWYRDTTLHWLRYGDYNEKPPAGLATIAEYQPHRAPQIVVVEPAAMHALHDAIQSLRRADYLGTLAELDRADSLQPDRNAAVFLASVGAKRAYCLFQLGRLDEAEREARRAAVLWPDNFDSGYVLASVALARGRLDEAERLLVDVLTNRPDDRGASQLLARVRAERRARGVR